MGKWKRAFLGLSVSAAAALLSFSASAASLPDHIVNGDFQYPSTIRWGDAYGAQGTTGQIGSGQAIWTYVINGRQCADTLKTGLAIPGFSQSDFGWRSNQPAMSGFGAGAIELQRIAGSTNVVAEMVAEDGNYAIYQDIQAEGDSVLYWSLKHGPRGGAYTGGDTMQVKIGSPGAETVQLATRTSNNGSSDQVGATMYTITTKKPNNTTYAPFESYEGRYVVPGTGTKTVRFTFNAGTAGSTGRSGNLLDDVVLRVAHTVKFDSNGGTSINYNPKLRNYSGYFVEGKVITLSSLTTAKPSRAGYTFLGWSEEPVEDIVSKEDFDIKSSEMVTKVTMPNDTKTVYAVWAVNPNVSFADRETVLSTVSTTFGGTVSKPSDPVRTGYDFTGWDPVISDHYYEDTTLSAVWSPRTYTLIYDKNNPSGASVDASDVNLSKASQQTKYDSAWGALATASKPGYVFLGWFTSPSGGEQITADRICQGDLTAYAHWRPIEYLVRFHPNTEHGGDDPEVTGTMATIRVKYDEFRKLPKNLYEKTAAVPSEDEGGGLVRKPSKFTGWSLDKLAISPSLTDEAGIMNLTKTDGDTIDLYAIWDDAPKFQLVSYPDRYFTLDEAHDGNITEEELLKTVIVYDRETNVLPKKPGGGPGPGVSIVNFNPSDFTDLSDDGSVSIRYKVEDGSGNTAYVNIMVHVSRNGGYDEAKINYYRSINEQYAGAAAGEGGLSIHSRWRVENDPVYATALNGSFDGSKTHDLYLNKEQMTRIRSYVGTKGFGNSESDDALSGFWTAIGSE